MVLLVLLCATVVPTTPRAGVAACGDLLIGEESRAVNLVLIVNDTMRRDRMGIQGGGASTPGFDAFARNNLWFDRAYSQAPWTKPSMATLFTGLYPSQHGLIDHPQPGASGGHRAGAEGLSRGNDVLSDEFTTLAEVLERAGFKTAAFVGNPWMRKRFGFAQGFDVYEDSFAGWTVPGETISSAGLEWLKQAGSDKPFFLYLHYMDSHRPYGQLDAERLAGPTPGVPGDAGDAEVQEMARHLRLRDGRTLAEAGVTASVGMLASAYDHGIEDFDRALGRFLEGFAAMDLHARTAIVVTSDHGEALFTRGYGNHGKGLYEDEIAVPLAMRLPGVSARRSATVRCPVGLIDLLPTLCDYFDVDCPATTFGRNLLAPATDRGIRQRHLVIQGVGGKPEHLAVRQGDYKLLWQPQGGPDGKLHRMFKVDVDPLEQRDLLAPGARTAAEESRANDLLHGAREEVEAVETPAKEYAPVDEETLERLRVLGYVD